MFLFSSFSPGFSSPGEKFTYVFEKGRTKFRSDFLNLNVKLFCDHTDYYSENYDKRRDIKEQLALNRSLCDYIIERIYNMDAAVITQPLQTILIEGVLPFDFQANNRTDLLNSLKWGDFVHHCYLTEVYLTHYMLEYSSWEQLLLDFSTCLHYKNYHQMLEQTNLITLDNSLLSFIEYLTPNESLPNAPLYEGPSYLFGSYISRK